jgi:hypothetical protein
MEKTPMQKALGRGDPEEHQVSLVALHPSGDDARQLRPRLRA